VNIEEDLLRPEDMRRNLGRYMPGRNMKWGAKECREEPGNDPVVREYNYGVCLQNGEGISIDLQGAAHILN
jgi:hypothetical protein